MGETDDSAGLQYQVVAKKHPRNSPRLKSYQLVGWVRSGDMPVFRRVCEEIGPHNNEGEPLDCEDWVSVAIRLLLEQNAMAAPVPGNDTRKHLPLYKKPESRQAEETSEA